MGKPSGGISHVTLFETPVKLATGIVLDCCAKRFVRTLSRHQFGAMLSCGTDQMLRILKALASDDVILVSAGYKMLSATSPCTSLRQNDLSLPAEVPYP